MELENRYKGLRTPHKMKVGVSGCTRECSEAQGNVVGIIATEKGWNLYVCVNGGMKPRHADLLAKVGVSGCTRECSEAQGNVVGIIATEKGWNLYVCVNGGMKPRHADLLAEDIDRETLIKYLDRFMMFYIRTADKLTRTAPWLENLEGGIEKLRVKTWVLSPPKKAGTCTFAVTAA